MDRQTIREINSNIFPMLHIFSGTYTKGFTIFGSLHNLIRKFKLIAKKLHKKEKEKILRSGLEIGPQAGPRGLGPDARCARCPSPHADTDGRSARQLRLPPRAAAPAIAQLPMSLPRR